jgi:hypothetical protein
MKRLGLLSIILSTMIFVPSVLAQEHDHAEVGVFGDYFRLNEAGNANFAGIGARIGFNVARYVQLEGGLTYDFEQNLNLITSTSTTATISRSPVTLLRGLAGPKLITGIEHAKVFGTVQGGFIRFGVSNGTITSGLSNSLTSFADNNTHAALYPGVGTEFYVGPVGFRLDVGDFMYWAEGVHHNLSVGFGPQFKF